MLERTLVFVDTSYLLASFYNSWETGARGQLEIDLREVVSVLDRMISHQLDQPVQRQMWYDGIPESGPHRYQRSLRTIDGVQLRAGQLIEWGDRRTQKAVDTRLVADMVIAGLRGQASDIVLVSGDADMLPGVIEASNAGVRVHLYGFGWDSMSGALRHACDSTTILDPREDFADAMQLNILEGPIPPVVRTKPLGDAEPIEDLGATAVPDTRDVVPGSHDDTETPVTAANTSLHDGSSAAFSEEHNDVAFEDPEGATPTAKANSPQLTEPCAAASPVEKRALKPQDTNESSKPVADKRCECDELEKEDREAEAKEQREAARAQESATAAPTPGTVPTPGAMPSSAAGSAASALTTPDADATAESSDQPTDEAKHKPMPRPNPSMMAPRRKLRSRYVPLPNEVWASAGFQTPFDVGQQYANWWYEQVATEKARDEAHLLSGGGLPAEIDRPLLQFACETLHEYTLTESQRVNLRDGFHAGIRGVLLARKNQQANSGE